MPRFMNDLNIQGVNNSNLSLKIPKYRKLIEPDKYTVRQKNYRINSLTNTGAKS